MSSTRRLAHADRLEAPFERGVFLDVLAVLVQRRGADAVELAAREHRLQHLGGVHRALGSPRAHDGVQLVDEEDDLPGGLFDLLEHGFQAVFELTAVLRPRDHRAEVERHQALALQALGNVALHDALREAFDDRRLADARRADEHGVVLRAPRKHLDRPADLLVPPDDRVEFAVGSGLREVAAVLLQRLVLALGVLVGHALVAAQLHQRLVDGIALEAAGAEVVAGLPLGLLHATEKDVLGRDVVVLEAFRLAFGCRQRGAQPRADVDLALAVDLRLRLADAPHGGVESCGVLAHQPQQSRDHTVLLFAQRQQDVLDGDLLLLLLFGELLRRDDGFLGFFGELLEVHGGSVPTRKRNASSLHT